MFFQPFLFLCIVSGCHAFTVRNEITLRNSARAASTATASMGERTRGDFPILKRTITDQETPVIYLDSGATSQKPQDVLDVLQSYYERTNSNVHRGAHTLSREATSAYEAARDKVAHFVNAYSRNEIVFTSGATEAINLVAHSYGRANLVAGDEIVLTVAEHHANFVPWQLLAQEKNLNLKFVHLDPETGGINVNELEGYLNERTKIVAFQHVSNVLACINPVKEIVQKVRRHAPHAAIVLDACQSLPHMVVDVQDLGVDFLAASGHKMCGPTGIGFLWGKEQLLNEMPPWKSGGEMIDQVTLESVTFQAAPGRFEAGTPAIAQAIGLGAAIDYLEKIGMKDIEEYEHELAEYLYEQLQTVPGLTLLGPKDPKKRAALCAFYHESIHPSDLSTFLDMDGIAVRAGHHCCQPLHAELGIPHSARASCYFYNTKEDIDALIASLKRTVDFFAGLDNAADEADDAFVPFI
jgi:cysteine desulfurase/selenocysteine lyase